MRQTVKRCMFAGGGTGGHLLPGIAVAGELAGGVRNREHSDIDVTFVDAGRPIEQRILAETPFRSRSLPVPPLSLLTRRPLRFWREWHSASRSAATVLDEEHPAVVVGMGAASSAPLVRQAARRGIPVVLLEQNRIAGRATRLLARHASVICLGLPLSGPALKTRPGTLVELTGNPLRIPPDSTTISPPTSAAQVLVITGGSQGSQSLNRVTLAALEEVAHDIRTWEIRHQTGATDVGQVRRRYAELGLRATVVDYTEQMQQWVSEAKLVISRAGATTLSELAAAGCPAVLVPYPHATQDHQRANAEYYQDQGGVRVLDSNASDEDQVHSLSQWLAELAADPGQLDRMGERQRRLARPDAAQRVADMIRSLVPVG